MKTQPYHQSPFLLVFILAACSDSRDMPQANISTAMNSLETEAAKTPVKEMAYPPTGPGDAYQPEDIHSSVTNDIEEPFVPKPIQRPTCPLDLEKRDDWEQLKAAKTKTKAEAEAEAATKKAPAPVPVSASYIAKQQRFFAIAVQNQAEWAALTAEEAERAYDELKQQFLGDR